MHGILHVHTCPWNNFLINVILIGLIDAENRWMGDFFFLLLYLLSDNNHDQTFYLKLIYMLISLFLVTLYIYLLSKHSQVL